jgi:hypothetical protein
MTIVTGKHKEILTELLLYYLNQADYIWDISYTIDDIKAQNKAGQWYINYYLNNYGN